MSGFLILSLVLRSLWRGHAILKDDERRHGITACE